MASDTYTARNVGAMGPNANANNINIIDSSTQIPSDIDLRVLSDELGKLKETMVSEAVEPKHFESLAAISAAEAAANEQNSAETESKLKSAGKWALDVATKIGVTVAAGALKQSIGLK